MSSEQVVGYRTRQGDEDDVGAERGTEQETLPASIRTPLTTSSKGQIGGRSRRVTQRLVTLTTDIVALASAITLVGGTSPLTTVALTAAVLAGVHALVPHPFRTFGGHLSRRWLMIAAVTAVVAMGASLLVPGEAPAIAPLAGAMLFALVASRTLLRGVAVRLRHHGVWLERTIIVGAGEVGQQLAEALMRRRDFGLRPIGFVDDIADTPAPLPLLGSPLGLREALVEHEATTVLLAFGPVKDPELVHRVRNSVKADPVRILALPRFFELGVTRHAELDTLWGYPLVELSPPPHHRATWRIKRVVDVVAAAAFLVLFGPLMALIALTIRATSPGPALFRQERVSLQGEPIQVLKFRTMLENDDSDVRWSVEEDDRVTRIGRILRPTHLDELPQLFNVLRGEMSMVGPRPERPHFVRQFNQEINDYQHRHRVPAGLTGLAQVNGLWGDTSIRDRSRLDNRYIEDWSLLADFRILGRTLGTLTGSRNGEPEGQPSSLAASDLEETIEESTPLLPRPDKRPAPGWAGGAVDDAC